MLHLTFLGTRGEIKTRTELHQWHTSLLIRSRGKKIMVDCGLDWKNKVHEIKPDVIVITHAHPDHAGGLEGWNDCPVYAPMRTWNVLRTLRWIGGLAKENQHVISLQRKVTLYGVSFEAFAIEHSTRAPAVGFRITFGNSRIWYSPDVLEIPDVERVLKNVQVYIGDGAGITRSIVHAPGGIKVGHASIKAELEWCRRSHVPRAILTHCGSEIVTSPAGGAEAKVARLGKQAGVESGIAHDGEELTF